MYLKRLEIQGFKSFANKTTLEFEKGITAVVGPNGSGKSNIADAIRWVLGEQSSKQLRGKKSEDVIFAGSECKSRLSFAEVTVTFDNDDRKIPLDSAEVSITRQIDRSSESNYLINGNKVRLLDVVDLILKSNIGTSRYTVIGQGTIDQMILSGPAEVKNLIDEASGVKTYYLRRDRTLKRLETTAQNLIRVQDLIAEIEPRLKSLRRQAKRMQERAVIEQELRQYQAHFYSQKYFQLKSSIAVFDARLSVLADERQTLESQIDTTREKLDASALGNRAEIEEYQKVQNEIKKLLDRKNKLTEDMAMIRGKLQAQKNVGPNATVLDAQALGLEKRKLENAKQRLQTELQKIEAAHQELELRTAEQRRLFETVSAKLAELQESLNNPEHLSFDEFEKNVDDLEHQFAEFYGAIEQGSEPSAIIRFANAFRQAFVSFKQRAMELARNPYANFEKQKRALQELLIQKDTIAQELNRLDLEKSKVSINRDYIEREGGTIEQRILQVSLEISESDSGSKDEYFETLMSEEQKLNADVSGVAAEIAELERSVSEYHAQEQLKKNELLDEEREYRLRQDMLSKLKDQESALQIDKAKLDTQRDSVVAEMFGALGDANTREIIQAMTPVQNAIHPNVNVKDKIAKLKNQLDMIGGIDELTLKEYDETEIRYTYLTTQVIDLQKGMDDLRAVIEELDGYIKKQFHAAFQQIDDKFQNYFRILFNGGRAYLSVVHAKDAQTENSENAGTELSDEASDAQASSAQDGARPEERIVAKYERGASDITGIDIKATPPGKKLSSISALSGGERALTSIALLCSLLSCFPSPFVVLDEVDAALDEANTIRFAEILGTLASYTQFVAVSHNRETMRKAHTLYGITMGDDSISKILSLKIDQAQAYAK